jgi:hypothetical protein
MVTAENTKGFHTTCQINLLDLGRLAVAKVGKIGGGGSAGNVFRKDGG